MGAIRRVPFSRVSGQRGSGGIPPGSSAATAYWEAAVEYPTLVDGAVSDLPDIISTNNATQSTAANRPVLSRADNLENRVLDSNITAMGAGIWGVTRATFESGTTITADGQTIRFIKEDATAGNSHFLITGTYLPIVSGVTYRISLIAYSTNRGLQVWCLDGLGSTSAYINLTTGASVSLGAGISAFQATDLGSGVYRYTFLVTATSTALSRLSLQLTNPASSTTSSYNGDNTSGAYIGAVQVQVATASSTYLATTTFPQYSGINGNAVPVFDGSNDSLATTIAVNPTGGMWGAVVVRRNATTTTRRIIGAYIAADASSRFLIDVTSAGLVTFYVFSNALSAYIARTTAAGALPTDTTCVLSFTYDGTTSATGIKIYINGVQQDVTTASAGVYAVPTAGTVLTIGQASGTDYFSGYLSPAVFGQGSTWADADRQATEQDLARKYIPNYVWFNPANNVTSDAGAVASWTDVTNTYVASQSTAANRPAVSTLNGQVAFDYDGTADGLTTNYPVNISNGLTCIIVVNADTLALGCFMAADVAGTTKRLQFIPDVTGVVFARLFSNTSDFIGRSAPAGTVVVGETAVFSMVYDGGATSASVVIYKNGVAVDTANSQGGSFVKPTIAGANLAIGGYSTVLFNGKQADAVIAPRAMSDSERQGWESRFMTQYGVV